MKTSFMTFACTDWRLDQIVAAANRYGYDGIEFRCDAGHLHGVEVTASAAERRATRSLLQRAEVEACCLATSLQFATDQVVDQAPARIELAADIGCPALRVFCGPRPEGASMDQVIDAVAKRLHMVAETSRQAGVQLWLETHDTFSKAADAGAAARRADHPVIGINYDNMHPYRMGEDLETTVAALGTLVRHTHFHDAINSPEQVVIRRVGEGQMPTDDMFAALVKMGYDGYLSGEWFHNHYGETPEESLEAYHEDMTDLALRHGVRLGR